MKNNEQLMRENSKAQRDVQIKRSLMQIFLAAPFIVGFGLPFTLRKLVKQADVDLDKIGAYAFTLQFLPSMRLRLANGYGRSTGVHADNYIKETSSLEEQTIPERLFPGQSLSPLFVFAFSNLVFGSSSMVANLIALNKATELDSLKMEMKRTGHVAWVNKYNLAAEGAAKMGTGMLVKEMIEKKMALHWGEENTFLKKCFASFVGSAVSGIVGTPTEVCNTKITKDAVMINNLKMKPVPLFWQKGKEIARGQKGLDKVKSFYQGNLYNILLTCVVLCGFEAAIEISKKVFPDPKQPNFSNHPSTRWHKDLEAPQAVEESNPFKPS